MKRITENNPELTQLVESAKTVIITIFICSKVMQRNERYTKEPNRTSEMKIIMSDIRNAQVWINAILNRAAEKTGELRYFAIEAIKNETEIRINYINTASLYIIKNKIQSTVV